MRLLIVVDVVLLFEAIGYGLVVCAVWWIVRGGAVVQRMFKAFCLV